MKKSLVILLFSCWATAGVYAQDGGYVDDLYRGSTKKSKKTESQATVQVQNQQGRQMPVNWTPAPASTAATSSSATTVSDAGSGELVISYDEALQRRLDAYKSYKEMDDSYWQLMESYHKMLSRKYDPDLYNIITFGNEMWVEPVYISALFDGSDPAAGVRRKEFVAPVQERTDVNISLNIGPGWWWTDPWHYYGWYAPWGYYGWGSPYYWGPYWGPAWSWRWGWGAGWGPAWHWGPGWGPGGPGYHPPYGGGPGPYHGRPVIWGNDRPGPGYRPGGSPAGRPGYSGGFRRNENGTGVPIGSGGEVNHRPGGSIRPGTSGNQYNPTPSSRPAVGGNGNGAGSRPSVDRSYRRGAAPAAPESRRESTPRVEPQRRSEPSYSAPSRGSGGHGGSIGGGGRGSVGGGGYRRR